MNVNKRFVPTVKEITISKLGHGKPEALLHKNNMVKVLPSISRFKTF